MTGLKLAQVSLAFGVNDIDGTVVEEKITHSAGVDTAEAVTRDELVRLIRNAGRVPVERDTLYNVVRRFDDGAAARRRARNGRRGNDAAGVRRPPVRVGRIEFVNCFPLYLHFEEELAARGFAAEIVAGTRRSSTRCWSAGRSTSPCRRRSNTRAHAAELVLLPGVSISSFGAVDSIQLFARVAARRCCAAWR